MSITRVTISVDIESIDGNSELASRDNQRLAQALEYGIRSSASIEELATICCQSVSTFKRKFRARYSMSPHQWLLIHKLELAHRIIEAKEIPISELTKMCGFNNTSHFIHRFRTRYGISPSQLGKMLRDTKEEDTNTPDELDKEPL